MYEHEARVKISLVSALVESSWHQIDIDVQAAIALGVKSYLEHISLLTVVDQKKITVVVS